MHQEQPSLPTAHHYLNELRLNLSSPRYCQTQCSHNNGTPFGHQKNEIKKINDFAYSFYYSYILATFYSASTGIALARLSSEGTSTHRLSIVFLAGWQTIKIGQKATKFRSGTGK